MTTTLSTSASARARELIRPTWLDRALIAIAPQYGARRLRARVGLNLLEQLQTNGLGRRHFEAAATGRRTQGWARSSADANQAIGPALARMRDQARDLVRNNPYAESAISTIADHAVGWGIEAKPEPMNTKTLAAWRAWAGTTACDADGRHDFYGLQKLVIRTVAESGEVLIRRRLRRPEDGYAIPLQLQILDPDFLDTAKDGIRTPNGGRIIQGIEFSPIGQRVAYWLFTEHPGSLMATSSASVRIPADQVQHCFRSLRPGQVRGYTWLAPIVVRFRDHDEFEDATLMKQKIAACLAVITTDVDGDNQTLGIQPTDGTADDNIDSLEPGAIINAAPGRDIHVVEPPSAGDYEAYSKNVLRGIATGIGVTYEDLTGDYTQMPFSAARMSRLRHEARITDWRWRLLIPQFCDPAWAWFIQVATIFGQAAPDTRAQWTAPPLPMVDPANEGLAEQRGIRTGIKSWSESVRERGYDPDELAAEIAADFKRFDELELVLDCDPRRMTQAGQAQAPIATPADAEADLKATTEALEAEEDTRRKRLEGAA